MTLNHAPLLSALLDAASEPCRCDGRFAYHFARGKQGTPFANVLLMAHAT